MSRSLKSARHLMLAAIAASVVAPPAAQAADLYWGTSSAGNWTDASTWRTTTSPFPTALAGSTDTLRIDQGNITVNSTTGTSGPIRFGNGGIGGGGFPGGLGTTGTLTIATGAVFGHTGNLTMGEVAGKSGTIVQTGGTFDKTNGDFLVGRAGFGTGTYLLQGGTLNITKGFIVASSSSFIQSGGTLNFGVAGGFLAPNAGTGLYEISGGTLNVGSASVNASIDIGSASGTFRVKGSAATLTARNIGGSNVATNKIEFRLDNSAAHISTLNGSAGFTSFGRRGNLVVSLNGGVLLAGASQFDVIKVDGFSGNDFNSRPVAATGLWTAGTVNNVDGTKDVERITLANNKGTVAFGNAMSFAASNYGHVSLTGVPLPDPLLVSLDLTGGTVANVTNALTAAGISWALGSGVYEVVLTLNPAVSGGTRFAWDFSSIDPAMTVQGVSLSAVPEPASIAMFMIPAAMMLRRRMRK